MIDSSNNFYKSLFLLMVFPFAISPKSNAQCDPLTQNDTFTYIMDYGKYHITFKYGERYSDINQIFSSLHDVDPPKRYDPKLVLCDSAPVLVWLHYRSLQPKGLDYQLMPWIHLQLFLKGVLPYHEIHNKSFTLETYKLGNYRVNKHLQFYKNNMVLRHNIIFEYEYLEFINLIKLVGLISEITFLIELRYEIINKTLTQTSARYTENIVFLFTTNKLDKTSIFNWIKSMDKKLLIELRK